MFLGHEVSDSFQKQLFQITVSEKVVVLDVDLYLIIVGLSHLDLYLVHEFVSLPYLDILAILLNFTEPFRGFEESCK